MNFTVHGGHAAQGNAFSGASGLCSESVEDRKIKEAVIKYLKQAGHTVYDCTVDSGPSQSAIITAIKRKINLYSNVTANISIHLNCYNGNAHGTECCIYSDNEAAKQMAQRICSKISSLGFTDRGVKKRTDLGVLKGIYNGGINILVETFFCDSQNDFNLYEKMGNSDAIGKAIAEGILNNQLAAPTENGPNLADVTYKLKQALHITPGNVTMQEVTETLKQALGIKSDNTIKKPINVDPKPSVPQSNINLNHNTKPLNQNISLGQQHANNFAGCGLNPDGIRGSKTIAGGIMCVQNALNLDYNSNLKLDGKWGPKSESALSSHYVKKGETQYLVTAVEILLMLKGYNPSGVESPGIFGNGLYNCLIQYQKDNCLAADGVAGTNTIKSLIH